MLFKEARCQRGSTGLAFRTRYRVTTNCTHQLITVASRDHYEFNTLKLEWTECKTTRTAKIILVPTFVFFGSLRSHRVHVSRAMVAVANNSPIKLFFMYYFTIMTWKHANRCSAIYRVFFNCSFAADKYRLSVSVNRVNLYAIPRRRGQAIHIREYHTTQRSQ